MVEDFVHVRSEQALQEQGAKHLAVMYTLRTGASVRYLPLLLIFACDVLAEEDTDFDVAEACEVPDEFRCTDALLEQCVDDFYEVVEDCGDGSLICDEEEGACL